MVIPGIRLLTFDVTNTLLKFHIPPWEYYAMIANKFGYKINGLDIKNKFLNNYKIMTKKHPNFGKETIHWQQWWNLVIEMTFQEEIPDKCNLDKISRNLIEDFKTATCWEKAEGSEDLIKILKESGIILGVISNFDPRLHEILFNLNIYDCFSFVLTSYEVGMSKPDKRIFEIAQAKCRKITDSSQCLHIGDDYEKDYIGAKAAGWHAILVTDKENTLNTTINKCLNLKELSDKIQKNKIDYC